MLDQANELIKNMQRAVDAIQRTEKLLEEAKTARNFAVVYKDDNPYFMVLSDEQARVVNGVAIPITDLPTVAVKARELFLNELAESLKVHQSVLTPVLTKSKPVAPAPAPTKPSIGTQGT